MPGTTSRKDHSASGAAVVTLAAVLALTLGLGAGRAAAGGTVTGTVKFKGTPRRLRRPSRSP